MIISKSDFLNYLQCSSNFWMTKHKPDLVPKEKIDPFTEQIIESGNEVELWARKLFPTGKYIAEYGKHALRKTKELIDQGETILFQPAFQVDDLLIRIDVLEKTPSGWKIYEVKGTSSQEIKKEVNLQDACFQKIVAERSGLRIEEVFLIELDKDFVKDGAIDPQQLLTITSIHEIMEQMQPDIELEIENAKKVLSGKLQPTSCDCYYLSYKNWCPSIHFFYPDMPAYPIHRLSRIGRSKKNFRKLIDLDIIDIEEVPNDYKDLSTIQLNQVRVHNDDKPIIDIKEIKRELNQLQYPLYFFDYETYPAAVPVYDGCSPFDQVPFQYSLHILHEPGGKYEHIEFLHKDASSPIQLIAESLCESIGKKGSIIAWHKSFEMGRNSFLAEHNSELAEHILSMNDRMYDLKDVFSKQFYVHKNSKGSNSIKDVLPILVPELTYDNLAIRNGGLAAVNFKELAFGKESSKEKEKIASDLLEYCKLDTWAMVRIYEELNDL